MGILKMRRFCILIAIMILFAAHSHAALKGKVKQVTFDGPITKKPVTFSIYFPENYDTDATKRYPVVYHLHGINGTHDGNQISTVPAQFESAKAKGLIGDVIIVFPDGYLDSFWADSYDGNKPAETNVIREIIPFVDSSYRTVPDKQHRFVEGFSMGGNGALLYFVKFPELFSKVSCYDGAFHTWKTLVSAHSALISGIFNNDETYFDKYSIWTYINKNVNLFKSDTLIKISEGALTNYHDILKSTFTSLSVKYEYALTGCAHQIGCLLTAEGENTAIFFNETLKGAATGSSIYEVDFEKFKIFPNPVSKTLNIRLNGKFHQECFFKIINSTGGEIFNGIITSGENKIDVSSFPVGVYVALMFDRNRVSSKILIVSH